MRSFVKRLKCFRHICLSMVLHYFSLINKCHSLLIFSAALEYSKRSFLDNVLYKRADGVDSLIATLDSVKAIADNNDDIKLVILDR